MKNVLLICLILMLAFSAFFSVQASAIPHANPVFEEASVYLYENFRAHFTASTMSYCSTISVTYCALQRLSGGRWVFHQLLPLPSYVAVSTSTYDDMVDYSSYAPSSGTYRIKATFSGGGESVTQYSNSRTR